LFEAGALAKQVAESRVVPYRLGVTSEDMTLPLAQFQGVEADREGTLKLVKSLNSSSTPPLDETSLLAGFERLWPALHTTIDRLRSAAPSTSPREIERERQKVRAFCTRVAGTWWERIPGEGIGFFQLEMDHLHNSARLADGRFYDEHANFRAYFNSAASRISQEGGRNRIVYVRECQNPSRDGANWFHGYGDVSFEGTGESLDRGHGTFYDMPSTDPKQAIARAVTLSRAPDENETIRIMARGTPAEQRALVRKMIARG
jgi:hypothetical protein